MSRNRYSFKTLAVSDIGLMREGNEDSALITPRLIAVADGMGGHAGGEVASKIAIMALHQLGSIFEDPILDSESKEDLLLNISYSIDDEILKVAGENPALTGMGTTLTALHLSEKYIELLHIGDSRAYRWTGVKLQQLSIDHTVLQELISQGRLTPEEVFNHPQRSLLTQALMGDSGLDPVLVAIEFSLGDKFLLCSDGLTSVLADYEIESIIKEFSDSQLVAALIEATKAKGAPDNITILWAEIVEGPGNEVQLIGAANE